MYTWWQQRGVGGVEEVGVGRDVVLGEQLQSARGRAGCARRPPVAALALAAAARRDAAAPRRQCRSYDSKGPLGSHRNGLSWLCIKSRRNGLS